MLRTRPTHPEEFRREAIKLAQRGDKPERRLATDPGISDVTLRTLWSIWTFSKTAVE